jgi:hypothetical protein
LTRGGLTGFSNISRKKRGITLGDIWYSRVRIFEGGCCSEYILTSRKPRKNNRRELVNNPEDQLLGFDTVRETVFGMEKELSIDESVNVKFDYEII